MGKSLVFCLLDGHVRRLWLGLSLLLPFSTNLLAQDTDAYIRNFKDIAVAEMLRTGIPASIKLAQAMVESNCGTSELACKANNHFGIKCGGDWCGKTFRKEDDDYKDGELTKSCFREFKSPLESYVAHSDFLTDPKKATRYGPLFQLKPTDYKAWAYGLLKAGYATDPAYAKKLIQVIEDNKLYLLDEGAEVDLATSKPKSSLGYSLVRYNNDVKYAVALADETVASISNRYDVSSKDLLRYNDFAYTADQIILKGSKVYLQSKRSGFHGKQKFHLLQPGQDLVFVAQEYGLKLKSLKKRNHIEGNEVPKPGQKIMLKGKLKSPLKMMDPYQLPTESEPVVPVAQATLKTTPVDSIQHKTVVRQDTTVNIVSTPVQKTEDHTVSKGETLYSIAQQYGLSVDELKKRNNLAVDTIFIGQILLVK